MYHTKEHNTKQNSIMGSCKQGHHYERIKTMQAGKIKVTFMVCKRCGKKEIDG